MAPDFTTICPQHADVKDALARLEKRIWLVVAMVAPVCGDSLMALLKGLV